MRAAKFEFIINLITAKALGLDIPSTLLAQADPNHLSDMPCITGHSSLQFCDMNKPQPRPQRPLIAKRIEEPTCHAGVRYGTNIVRWGIATLATYGKVAIVITIIAR
jgi:hypothetical protein